MTKKLTEVESDAAAVGGERRDGLRMIVTGRTLFLFAAAPREYPRKDGTGNFVILPFKTWTPRGDALWLEVVDPEHIKFVQGLVEGQQIEIAGQITVKPRTLGGLFVTVRVFSLARASQ